MLKEIIIIIAVISTIVTTNWWLQNYTKHIVNEVSDNLKELKQVLKDENEEKIKSQMKAIKEKWSNHYRYLAVFIEHNELEKVESNLIELESLIEIADFSEGINEVNKCMFSLNHIAKKYDFCLENVF